MKPKVSIVIRNKNEASKLKKLILKIKEETQLESAEIIVVDNESEDQSREVAERLGARIVTITENDFTHPASMNLGAKSASGAIVILTVAHALPISSAWIKSATKHFSDKNVAGVYGPALPFNDSPLAEKLFAAICYGFYSRHKSKSITFARSSVFGAVSIAFRKELWEKHHFDERYESGGEDTNWAKWALKNKYKIIFEPNFAVYHSHYLTFMPLMGHSLRYIISWHLPQKLKKIKNPSV